MAGFLGRNSTFLGSFEPSWLDDDGDDRRPRGHRGGGAVVRRPTSGKLGTGPRHHETRGNLQEKVGNLYLTV